MEFKFNINEIFKEPIVEVSQNLIPPGFTGDKRALWDTVTKVSDVVNAMGEASAAAQGLTKPITTAERLRNSEHQKLYFLVDKQANNGRGAVSGMLKTGSKGLYVFDKDGRHYKVTPPCVLDFYVHESKQRNGLGKQLFEHMLQKEETEPVKMALDRPSDNLMNFLDKYYALNVPVKQMNNYVVFDGFFPNDGNAGEERSTTPGKKSSANGLQSHTSQYGRYGAPRPPCSMGQIIHNQTSTLNRNLPAGVQSLPVTNIQGNQTSLPLKTPVTQSVTNVSYGERILNNSNTAYNQHYLSLNGIDQAQSQAEYPGDVPNAPNAYPIPPNNSKQYNMPEEHIMQTSGLQQQPNEQGYYNQGPYPDNTANQNYPAAQQQAHPAYYGNVKNQQYIPNYTQQNPPNNQNQPDIPAAVDILGQPIVDRRQRSAAPAPSNVQQNESPDRETTYQQPNSPTNAYAQPQDIPQQQEEAYSNELQQQQRAYSSELQPQQRAYTNDSQPQQRAYSNEPQLEQSPTTAHTTEHPQDVPPAQNVTIDQSEQRQAPEHNQMPEPTYQNQPSVPNLSSVGQHTALNQIPEPTYQNQPSVTNVRQPTELNQIPLPPYQRPPSVPYLSTVQPVRKMTPRHIDSRTATNQYHQMGGQQMMESMMHVTPDMQQTNSNQYIQPQAIIHPQHQGGNRQPTQPGNQQHSIPRAAHTTNSADGYSSKQIPDHHLQAQNAQGTMSAPFTNYNTPQNAASNQYGTNSDTDVGRNPPQMYNQVQQHQTAANNQYGTHSDTAVANNQQQMYNQGQQVIQGGQAGDGSQNYLTSQSHSVPNMQRKDQQNVPSQQCQDPGSPELKAAQQQGEVLQYGYPPQFTHEVTNEDETSSAIKKERPRSLSIQQGEDQTEENYPKNFVTHPHDPNEIQKNLENIKLEEPVEKQMLIPMEEAELASARKTPSHLTEQGYFDLKFYHNKLW